MGRRVLRNAAFGLMLALCGCRSGATPSPDAGIDAGETTDAGGPAADAGDTDAGMATDWFERGDDGRRFTARCDAVSLTVEVRAPGVVRLRYLGTDSGPDRSLAVVGAPEQTEAAVEASDERVRLTTAELSVEIGRDCRIRAAHRDGTVLVDDPEAGGYFESAAGTRGVKRRIAADEHFYGFGEKTGPLDKRGRTMEMWNTDAFDAAWGGFRPGGDPLYQAIPFFIGLRGDHAYGVFTDNTWRSRFDMGATDPSSYWVIADGGAIDQYLIAGPSIDQVVRRYTGLTGRMPLPPRWALGFHQSRWGYYPASKVRDIAAELRRRELPADGLFLDIQHMDGFRSFTWDRAGFPDPAGLLAELEGMGFKTTLIVDPGIKVDPGWDVYRDGVAGGHFLRGADGQPYVGEVWPGPAVFPDFSAAKTRAWWSGLVARGPEVGARGVWIDMNEPASFLEAAGKTVPGWVEADGDGARTTMAEVHNVYALHEARATWEGLRSASPGKRPFVLTRAGYAGIQRYAAVWTGDAPSAWETLSETVPMLLGLGLLGVTFAGSDVGGYSGKASAELYARWMQVGAFSPFFRAHCATDGNPQEPWAFGSEVESISRVAMRERYELLPYLYSLMHQASKTGVPALRPLVYEFQSEPETHAIGDEVMLGPWLLYAPVLEAGAPTRRVFLPAGRWFDQASGAIREGPTSFELPLTLAARPAFVREGAILPRFDAPAFSDQARPATLYLDVYPSAKATAFELYEDDGETDAHERGQYARVRYTLQGTDTGATLDAGAREGSWEIGSRGLVVSVRRVDHGVRGVKLDGEALPSFASREALLGAGRGWFHDAADLSLVVVMPDRAGFSLAMDYDPAISEPAPEVEVRFEVELPAGTPTERPICIASSANGWAHQPLQWGARPGTAVGTLKVPRGQWFHYKFTRGDWETVEKWDACQEATNRYGYGAAHPERRDAVVTWADTCN